MIQEGIMAILITGGSGYIGSHTAVELIQAGYEVIIVDNLSNSKPEVCNRIKEITGIKPKFYELNLLNEAGLNQLFDNEVIESVIHFAGYKAVGESVDKPLAYYENNVTSTINLCKVMQAHQVNKLIFSSSATVYGQDGISPLVETLPLSATNPYGNSKVIIENILKDLSASNPKWQITSLRYFNPIGAHQSGLIGEEPSGIPNNLLPFITQVAIGKMVKLAVFGNDYDTPDGTGVRDYIHVLDLAKGHIAALNQLEEQKGYDVFNLGTGKGCSVLDIISTFELVNQVSVPYMVVERRPGDIAACYADTHKAEQVLGWQALYTLEDMCRDSWNWQKKNPDGY
jgi:UDP-glucose 4-epimerase